MRRIHVWLGHHWGRCDPSCWAKAPRGSQNCPARDGMREAQTLGFRSQRRLAVTPRSSGPCVPECRADSQGVSSFPEVLGQNAGRLDARKAGLVRPTSGKQAGRSLHGPAITAVSGGGGGT